jgi:hypothetical protein
LLHPLSEVGELMSDEVTGFTDIPKSVELFLAPAPAMLPSPPVLPLPAPVVVGGGGSGNAM